MSKNWVTHGSYRLVVRKAKLFPRSGFGSGEVKITKQSNGINIKEFTFFLYCLPKEANGPIVRTLTRCCFLHC